jgi:hypothetical protein
MKKLERNETQLATRSEPLTIEEIKAHPDFLFEPWFRSKRVACQIRVLKSVPEREAWTAVFEEHGCILCGTKKKAHSSLGMCSVCHQRVARWLREAVSLRSEGKPETFTFDSEAIARTALADALRMLSAAATEDDDDQS